LNSDPDPFSRLRQDLQSSFSQAIDRQNQSFRLQLNQMKKVADANKTKKKKPIASDDEEEEEDEEIPLRRTSTSSSQRSTPKTTPRTTRHSRDHNSAMPLSSSTFSQHTAVPITTLVPRPPTPTLQNPISLGSNFGSIQNPNANPNPNANSTNSTTALTAVTLNSNSTTSTHQSDSDQNLDADPGFGNTDSTNPLCLLWIDTITANCKKMKKHEWLDYLKFLATHFSLWDNHNYSLDSKSKAIQRMANRLTIAGVQPSSLLG
jgi:hypothetical protein